MLTRAAHTNSADVDDAPQITNPIHMKTNKSYTKRIKVTKTGKLVARRPGQNHYNAKESGTQRLARKRTQTLSLPKRVTRRFLPKSGA